MPTAMIAMLTMVILLFVASAGIAGILRHHPVWL
jgi:hypothetical protein